MSDSTRTFFTNGHADVAVVVVTYNSAGEIEGLLSSLRAESSAVSLRVVVADNSSSDQTLEILATHEDVIVVASGGNLGYAGGVNTAIEHAGEHDAILVLNPDLRVEPGSIGALVRTMRASPQAGVIAPRIVGEDGTTSMSLFNEPTALRGWADALLGPVWKTRPAALSEWIRTPSSYETPRTVEWVTGAAMLIPRAVAQSVGEWDERFFLYSEETDYCRRVRDAGYQVQFDPAATMMHSQGKSGSSPELDALLNVNRIRYMRKHSPGRAGLYRGAALVGASLRARRSISQRRSARYLRSERTWRDLPHATWTGDPHAAAPVASIVIPAHNEAGVIARTLTAIAEPARLGVLDVIVACNGCSDDTAAIASGFAGVRVLENAKPSKIEALNAGDAAAAAWPRIYLDADIEIPTSSIPTLLRSLRKPGILAGRPRFEYETRSTHPLVQAYFRARMRVPALSQALWGAGVYAVSEQGHHRMGHFPPVIADDVFVDRSFSRAEKSIPLTAAVVVRTPRTVGDLVKILTRARRGPAEQGVDSGASTLATLLRSIRGPVSLWDATIFVGLTATARRRARISRPAWERDDSSRTT